jgi:hypothetical protein
MPKVAVAPDAAQQGFLFLSPLESCNTIPWPASIPFNEGSEVNIEPSLYFLQTRRD